MSVECNNCEYMEEIQGNKWYVSWKAGFIFKAAGEDLLVLC